MIKYKDKTKQVTAIVAYNNINCIGKDGKLMWHLPKDLKNFKRVTTGHVVIMGRNTYESIGKPLSNRLNIVITSNPDLEIEGVTVVNSMYEAYKVAMKHESEKIFVIGGGTVYRNYIHTFDNMIVTTVDNNDEGDTYFPIVSHDVWEEKEVVGYDEDDVHFGIYNLARIKPCDLLEITDVEE